jgi:hypothetical protein
MGVERLVEFGKGKIRRGKAGGWRDMFVVQSCSTGKEMGITWGIVMMWMFL